MKARLLVFLMMFLVMPAAAMVAHSDQVDQKLRVLMPDARLAGEGRLRVFGFHVYDARLFVGAQGLSAAIVADQPFALDLRYARSFSGSAIAKRTRQEMARLDFADDAQRRAWEASLSSLFPDVDKGDHLTGVYLPDQQRTLFLENGQVIGDMPGADFALAFFSIWLHPESSAPDMRSALLENAEPVNADQLIGQP